MKDKEKQIEEMAKVIKSANEINCIRTCDNCNYYNDDSKCISFGQAIALYEQGYRKLPENSVVLSREEYEKLKMLEEGHITCEDVLEFVEKARKETAEKIINMLKQPPYIDFIESWVLEDVAKQFGVEIKE